MSLSLNDKILTVLETQQGNYLTALEISKLIKSLFKSHHSKKDINQRLYNSLKTQVVMDGGQPPRWSLSSKKGDMTSGHQMKCGIHRITTSSMPLSRKNLYGNSNGHVNKSDITTTNMKPPTSLIQTPPPMNHPSAKSTESPTLSSLDINAKPKRQTFVVIDLGNVHDCLEKIVYNIQVKGMYSDVFVEMGTNVNYYCKFAAFADPAYNGFPFSAKTNDDIRLVNRNAGHILSTVFVSRVSDASCGKNAADLEIISCILDVIHEQYTPVNFVVVTKDLQFTYLKNIVERKNHQLCDNERHSYTTVTNWHDLQTYLEQI